MNQHCSRNNCLLDRLEEYVMHETGCLIPSLGHVDGVKDMHTCGPSGVVTIVKVWKMFTCYLSIDLQDQAPKRNLLSSDKLFKNDDLDDERLSFYMWRHCLQCRHCTGVMKMECMSHLRSCLLCQESPINEDTLPTNLPIRQYLFNSDNRTSYMSYVSWMNSKQSMVQDRINQIAIIDINFGKSFVEQLTLDTKTTFSSRF